MAEFRLVYNPFTVETALFVKRGGDWVPVNEDSGLLRISKMRMQRWLEPLSGPSFFDELREAAGEDDLDIFFSGTKEDMEDLSSAADAYSGSRHDVRITVRELGSVQNNSSKAKLEKLRHILESADASDFRAVLPKKMWAYLSHCLDPYSGKAVLIPFSEWPQREADLFDMGAWKLICLAIPYEELRLKETRELFRTFARRLDHVADRRFDRERFLFLCYDETGAVCSKHTAERTLLEYGLQDLNMVVLSREEFEHLEDLDQGLQGEALKRAQQNVLVFSDRYAEQYRLRKMHDIMLQMFREEGFVNEPKLYRKVEERLRGNGDVTDQTVKAASNWLSDFLGNIEHLLDVDTTDQYFDR